MHPEDKAHDAREMFARLHIDRSRDFHTLSASEVDALLVEADLRKYRKPANANGSRGRYFYAMMQKRASKAE